ncbi:hypothetical protein [Streptomyces odonnellii]|uniref:hypothetical protein n=1 Tax=Streptomyces odonnellii TaxID=1417980 RepID=UPI00062612C8|nr:hypothetical protein [Streptomyces odonnellii]
MNLRAIGFAAVAVFAVLLPVAATAGSSDPARPGEAVKPAEGSRTGSAPGALDAKPGPGRQSLSGIDGSATPTDAAATSSSSDDPVVRAGERCGPEVASPEGIEARTCVLSEGRDTWARTHYRNASGDELVAALSLMGPHGRTVQTQCVVAATAGAASCQTPREPSLGELADYTAIAEFAASTAQAAPRTGGDSEEIGPLLLRVGSNS